MGALKITEGIHYTGDYYILFSDGKSWYGIWCLSVREASLAMGMLSHGYQAHLTEKGKVEFPSFSRWSQLGLFLSSLTTTS